MVVMPEEQRASHAKQSSPKPRRPRMQSRKGWKELLNKRSEGAKAERAKSETETKIAIAPRSDSSLEFRPISFGKQCGPRTKLTQSEKLNPATCARLLQ